MNLFSHRWFAGLVKYFVAIPLFLVLMTELWFCSGLLAELLGVEYLLVSYHLEPALYAQENPVKTGTGQGSTAKPADAPVEAVDSKDNEFDQQAQQLAARLRTAPASEQSKLRADLEALNDKHFEYRQQQRKNEIERLSGRVDALRLLQLRRQENKTDILKRRLQELLDAKEETKWDQGATSANSNSNPTSSMDQLDPGPAVSSLKLSSPISEKPEPWYAGNPASYWLSKLEKERDPSEVEKALHAMSFLQNDIEPQSLVRAVLHASSVLNNFKGSNKELRLRKIGQEYAGNMRNEYSQLMRTLEILRNAPRGIVIDEMISILDRATTTKPLGHGFKMLLTTFIVSVGSRFQDQTIYSVSEIVDVQFVFDARAWQETLRKRSRRFVSTLAKLSEKDSSQDEWVLETSRVLLTAIGQPLESYPDLIPVIHRVFTNSGDDKQLKFWAAELLGESGRDFPDVIDFLAQCLKRGMSHRLEVRVGIQNMGHFEQVADWNQFQSAANHLSLFGPKSKQAVQSLMEELSSRWKDFESINVSIDAPESEGKLARPEDRVQKRKDRQMECVILTFALGEASGAAKDALPLLREIVDSESAKVLARPYEDTFPVHGGNAIASFGHPRLLEVRKDDLDKVQIRDHVLDAIKQIEEGKPKPTPTPLPDDEPETSQKILDPEQDQTKIFKRPLPKTITIEGEPTSTEANSVNSSSKDDLRAKQVAVEEQTYDGIPYSQWLKWLETERKPDKLMSAIDACSRLAVPDDERRIARLIFQSAPLFESKIDGEDYRAMSTVGTKALSRLSGDCVLKELLAALNDDNLYKVGRNFQVNIFVLLDELPAFAETIKDNPDELISCLLRKNAAQEKHKDQFLFMACSVWVNSKRPLSDFEGLGPQLISRIDAGDIGVPNWPDINYWLHVAESLILHAPETPDLAVKVLNAVEKTDKQHSEFNTKRVFSLLPEMGRHLEPAVPLLVDKVIASWTTYEKMEFGVKQDAQADKAFSDYLNVINVLGSFDGTEKSNKLFRQLRYPIYGFVPKENETIKIIERVVAGLPKNKPAEDTPPLFSEYTLLHGPWMIRSVSPQMDITGGYVVVRRGLNWFPSLAYADLESLVSTPTKLSFKWPMEINPSKVPKEINFGIKPGKRIGIQLGIYEFTGDKLRLQINKSELGKPRPVQFANENTQLPEGQILLELERPTDEEMESIQ